MPTYSEIEITFTDAFEPNTGTNSLVVAYSDSLNGTGGIIQEKIVTTRATTGEFSTGTDAATQAQFYKDALDLDIVPSGDWVVEISGAVVTIKSNLDYIQFVNVYAGAPNDTRFSFTTVNYSIEVPQTDGIILARSNYYVNREINDPAIVSQEVSLWFFDEQFINVLPAEPDYKITQLRPSTNWSEFDLSISSYARDYLRPSLPDINAGLNPSKNGSVITTSVSIKSNLDAITQPVINQSLVTLGYAGYQQGATPVIEQSILLSSTRHQVKAGALLVVPVYTLGGLTEVVMKDQNGTVLDTIAITETDFIIDAISYAVFDTSGVTGDYVTINDTYRFELVNECTYPTEVVYFLNRYGVFEGFTFFKASKSSVSIDREGEFKNNYVIGGAYSANKHLYRSTNVNARESMQFTTGYINEQQNAAIEDILLSDYIYLADGQPINVDTNNIEKKTRIVDKLISYEIGFKMSSDKVQTV